MNLRLSLLLLATVSTIVRAQFLRAGGERLENATVFQAVLAADADVDFDARDQRRVLNWDNGPDARFSSRRPLPRCYGDCGKDSHCEGDLVCDDRRTKGEPKPVPGCSISSTEDSGTDFCVRCQDLDYDHEGCDDGDKEEQVDGDGGPSGGSTVGWNEGPDVFWGDKRKERLERCQGDCSSDSHCDGDLVCDNSREKGEPRPVPGCSISSTEDSGTDYCVYKADKERSDASSGSPPPPSSNGKDREDDSEGGLDYNAGGPDLKWIAENPNEAVPTNERLGLCEGDCDSDYTCQQGLMCWQRSGGSHVPGCDNGGSGDRSGKDYCVDEKYRGTDGDQTAFPGDDIFRLKLFWREGYHWQEETFERKWCVECLFQNCDSGSLIYLSECSQKKNDDLEFVKVENQYYQVKLAEGNKCWERNGNAMSWETCDSDDTDQHFFANKGSFENGDRFEIRPRNQTGKCVTQLHHPKWAEWMELQDCHPAELDQTNFWEKY